MLEALASPAQCSQGHESLMLVVTDAEAPFKLPEHVQDSCPTPGCGHAVAWSGPSRAVTKPLIVRSDAGNCPDCGGALRYHVILNDSQPTDSYWQVECASPTTEACRRSAWRIQQGT